MNDTLSNAAQKTSYRKRLTNWLKPNGRLHRFITRDIFCLDTREMPKLKGHGVNALKIAVLSLRKFMADQCPLRASALTFYTLLSIVPVAALTFGIAKGFGLDKRLEQDLYLRFSGQQEVVNFVINFARTLLKNTQGGLVAGIGVMTLLLSVIKVLNHIESAFNLIWKVKSRTFERKFSDYLAIMLTGPLLFIVASSVTIFIRTKVEAITANAAILDLISPIIFTALKLLPYLLVWMLFTVIYLIMPNTRVRLGSAFLAAVVAGTLYQFTQIIYINFQIFVANYNAIYGSFAALPLFMVWLQISWLILLLGAEISRAHHSADSYSCMPGKSEVSFRHRKIAALQLIRLVVHRFVKGAKPATAEELARELRLPIDLVKDIITQLNQKGVLSLVLTQKRNSNAIQPGMDIQHLTIQTVITALEHFGDDDFAPHPTPKLNKIQNLLEMLTLENQSSKTNCLIKDL